MITLQKQRFGRCDICKETTHENETIKLVNTIDNGLINYSQYHIKVCEECQDHIPKVW